MTDYQVLKKIFYYKGIYYTSKEEWSKAVVKEYRRIKIKKLNNSEQND